MTLVKNSGRSGVGRDATWTEYRLALPGRPEEVANRLGLSLRRVEKSLEQLRRLGLVERRELGRYVVAEE